MVHFSPSDNTTSLLLAIRRLDVAIFDPDLDPDGGHAARIVACLAAMLAPDLARR
jgi:hypothetical protein